MRAIVLAAGTSERMGGDVNKCIMPMNDKGDTMLGRVLGQLKALCVWPTVVVGYQAEEIMRRHNEVSFAYNPEYETTGSLYSAWLAWTVMPPSTVVMMVSGSNIITDEALGRLYHTMTWRERGVAVVYPYPHHLKEVRNVYHYLNRVSKFGEDHMHVTECFPHDHSPLHNDYALSSAKAYSQFMMVRGTTLNSIPAIPNWRTVNSGWLIKGCGAIEVDAGDTLDVNTPHDFELAKEMIKSWSS